MEGAVPDSIAPITTHAETRPDAPARASAAGRTAEHDPQVRADEKALAERKVARDDATRSRSAAAAPPLQELRFERDDVVGRWVATMVDPVSGEVLRSLPPTRVLHQLAALAEAHDARGPK
jgi:uncharacterized FlaG/YvyC family protein